VLTRSEPRSSTTLTSNDLQRKSTLALAVDRAVPGASNAWSRLQTSPTVQATDSVDNYRNFPATCFTPRSQA
jgi:hypothetical protein